MTDNVYYAENRKRRKKINWLPLIIMIFFGSYISLQIYLMNANSVDTVKAVEGYLNDSIITQGIICRQESVLTKNGSGVVDYLAETGERVSGGHHIADVYPSYTDIENIRYLRNRQSMLEDIQKAESYFSNSAVDMTTTRKELTGQLSDLAFVSQSGGYESINDELANLTLNLNKISVATGRTTNFSAATEQLKNEINSVKANINTPSDTLYTPHTGYFLQNADGYEYIATVDNFLAISYEEGMNIINQSQYSPAENSYGKIITDYKWCICVYLDKDQCSDIKEGASLKLSIDVGSNNFVKTTVKKVVDKGEKNLVVFECTTMSNASITERITDCEILFKQYNGIKIPKSAVRFDDEQHMGVFVNFSNIVNFKRITPVYEDDNYMIVPVERNADNRVKLYDSIIVKGRNLYDGKYL